MTAPYFLTYAAVRTTRIPIEGLKHVTDRRWRHRRDSPNNQNPDRGIETASLSIGTGIRSGPNNQNPYRGIETVALKKKDRMDVMSEQPESRSRD